MTISPNPPNKKAGIAAGFCPLCGCCLRGMGSHMPLLLLVGWMPLEVQHNVGALFAAL
jgi:hypothetical protein